MSEASLPLPQYNGRAPVPHPGRDPARMLAETRHRWGGRADLWVFGYASLIWRPSFDAVEHRVATVHGWHRALQMHSRINRGTPERPGLVCAMVSGGCCRGIVYRVPAAHADGVLERLWEREMITGVYDPRFLLCRTAQGPVTALAFTLSRGSPNHTGPIADDDMLHILRGSTGRYGSTLEYLRETARSLRERGIVDSGLERLCALAQRHGL